MDTPRIPSRRTPSALVSALVEVRDGSGNSHDALRGTW
jgi:hypothetical protein